MFKDNNGPLMYINSVQTPNNQKFGQQVFDSRNPIKIKKETREEKGRNSLERKIKLSEEEISLLNKIITLKTNDSSVKCEFYCENLDKVFIGIPISLEDQTLLIENEGIIEELDLYEVTNFLIS